LAVAVGGGVGEAEFDRAESEHPLQAMAISIKMDTMSKLTLLIDTSVGLGVGGFDAVCDVAAALL
jgi:hypothetical protein